MAAWPRASGRAMLPVPTPVSVQVNPRPGGCARPHIRPHRPPSRVFRRAIHGAVPHAYSCRSRFATLRPALPYPYDGSPPPPRLSSVAYPVLRTAVLAQAGLSKRTTAGSRMHARRDNRCVPISPPSSRSRASRPCQMPEGRIQNPDPSALDVDGLGTPRGARSSLTRARALAALTSRRRRGRSVGASAASRPAVRPM